MEPLSYWIDEGARKCGSQNKLAARLGATSSTLSEMRTGRRPMPGPMLEELARLCGLDPKEHAARYKLAWKLSRIEKQARAMGVLSVLMLALTSATLATLPSAAQERQAVDSADFFAHEEVANNRSISAAAMIARAVRGLSSMAAKMAQSILKAMRGQMLPRMISAC